MTAKLKKQYEALRKKHKLPAFDELDSELEISSIDTEHFLLRHIRRKIEERVHELSCTLEQVLQPDTNLVDLYESRVFDEDEKRKLFELYKRFMVAARQAAELSVLNDDKLDAEFVKSFSAEWKGLKPELAKFIRKLREAWEKDTEKGETAAYMG